MSVWREVNTRKNALIEQMGFTATEVITDRCDTRGFEVFGDHLHRKDVKTSMTIAMDEPLTTRIEPIGNDAKTAWLDAVQGDFAEAVGPDAMAQMNEMAARLARN